jgi:hypothetical protein
VAAVVVVVVATAVVAGVAAPAPAAPLHQLPARVGATPPGRPSTTPGLAPSTCGRACQGHQSRPDHRTPSSLYHRWGHRSRLLRCVCVFLALHHLSSSPGEWDPQSLNGSFSTMELTPPCPPLTGWPTLAPSTTPPSTQVASHLPTPLRLSIPTPSLLVMVPFYPSPQ